MSEPTRSELSEQASEEVDVLVAVFGEEQCAWSRNSGTLTIDVPEGVRLRFKLPADYPSSAAPSVDVVASRLGRAEWLQETACRVLQTLWEAKRGVVLFDCVESIRSQVQDLVAAASASQQPASAVGQQDGGRATAEWEQHLKRVAQLVKESPLPLVDRKSTFIGHLCPCATGHDVEAFLEVLLSNRKIASATHNIMAFRIQHANGILADCDDNGEHGAGKQLLQLLTASKVINVCVVVSRWFGGTQLGPDRFKHINNVARELLVTHGFIAPP